MDFLQNNRDSDMIFQKLILSSPKYSPVVQSIRAFVHMPKIGCLNLSHDKPKSLKQEVTAPLLPLLNAMQQMRMSWVLGDDHYKRVTVGVAH